MEIKEVIRTLEDNLAVIAESFGPAVGTAISEAIKACEYRVGKRVDDYAEKGDVKSGFCPVCGNFEAETRGKQTSICDKCGQTLDWQLSQCIATKCIDCKRHSSDGAVCWHYADKADEIRRVYGGMKR